ncbi:hypothetical protein PSTT_08970 [Puccinia striiformis]|uniref:Uncharacterized protein n=1 Tax=Puccinia striiformis TaxID=27350 RepID=A0A2S4VAB7_9BASI|nr:hypothetical protein PSTT_08970 [Puccinia striiformis]
MQLIIHHIGRSCGPARSLRPTCEVLAINDFWMWGPSPDNKQDMAIGRIKNLRILRLGLSRRPAAGYLIPENYTLNKTEHICYHRGPDLLHSLLVAVPGLKYLDLVKIAPPDLPDVSQAKLFPHSIFCNMYRSTSYYVTQVLSPPSQAPRLACLPSAAAGSNTIPARASRLNYEPPTKIKYAQKEILVIVQGTAHTEHATGPLLVITRPTTSVTVIPCISSSGLELAGILKLSKARFKDYPYNSLKNARADRALKFPVLRVLRVTHWDSCISDFLELNMFLYTPIKVIYLNSTEVSEQKTVKAAFKVDLFNKFYELRHLLFSDIYPDFIAPDHYLKTCQERQIKCSYHTFRYVRVDGQSLPLHIIITSVVAQYVILLRLPLVTSSI